MIILMIIVALLPFVMVGLALQARPPHPEM